MLQVIEQLTIQMRESHTFNFSIEEPKIDRQVMQEVRSEPLSASKRQDFRAFAQGEDFVDQYEGAEHI